MSILVFIFVFLSQPVMAQVANPVSSDFVQLQQLIKKSEEQVEALKEIIKYKKQDSASLDRANKILDKMTDGIDKSIEKYKGTEVYQKALLELQEKDDFKKTYAEGKKLKEMSSDHLYGAGTHNVADSELDDIVSFQKNSVKANQSDAASQKQIQQALQTAQPGFVPKLQAQVELGNWRTSSRVSVQMTELLAAIHAMREELRVLRLKDQSSNTLNTLVNGSEIQNKKLQEASHQ